MTRAPSLRSLSRNVLCRDDRMWAPLGAGVSISQYAAVCRARRTWLAMGERQLVRSEASWLLWILFRFSAWPRAHLITS
ncbi:hypothetical protein X735_32820 [Mesorhizobium sp. L2C085B000]|nr:hypothetical protein X735_32820 [Mesorhizobium sp. L2C085B000]